MEEKKSTLSVCLVVYNEEDVIERCLTSVQEIADEIIVIHDGPCNDSTIDLCKKYTQKIFTRPRIGEAEPHRPFAFKEATSEWILSLDADEFLSHRLKVAIKGLINNKNIDAYSFIWPFTDGKRQFSLKFPHRLCLARKSKLFFFGFPHESMQTTGILKRTEYIIEHWPKYNNYTLRRFLNKILPWIKIHAKYIWMDLSMIESFNTNNDSHLVNLQNSYRHNPLLKIPYRFIRIIVLQVYGGFLRAGINGIRVVLFSAFYEAFLLYYVHKYRKD